jgi:hypothetical protein
MSTDQLSLTFSETVKFSSLNPVEITLQSRSNFNNSIDQKYSFQTSSVFGNDSTVINISISKIDSNSIKKLTQLAVSSNYTFLSMTSFAVTDMALVPNAVVSIFSSAALPVTRFTADLVRPSLVAFSLNLSSEVLTLTFDETVNSSSLWAAGITLQNAASGANQSFTLTGGVRLSMNDAVISLVLLHANVNSFAKLRQLCISAETCFVSITSAVVSDLAGNWVNAVLTSNAHIAGVFVTTAVQPRLIAFNISMDGGGRVVLIFDKTIMASTFNPSYITLQSSSSLSGPNFSFTNGTFSVDAASDSDIIEFDMIKADLDAIKLIAGLAISAQSSYLAVTGATAKDMFGNNLRTETVGPAVQFSADITPPQITSYEFNFTSNKIVFFFSEPVMSLDINISSIRISNGTSNTSAAYSLTTASTSTFPHPHVVIIALAVSDQNKLKSLRIALTSGTCWLSATPRFIADTAGNGLFMPAARLPDVYTPDGVQPVMSSYVLNMNTGSLDVTFNEPILASSITFTQFELTNGSLAISLQSTGAILGDLVETFTFNLTKAIYDHVESNSIALSLNTSLLNTLASAYVDASANTNRPQTLVTAAGYVADTSLPRMQSFSLDLNASTLSLFFSEAVDISALDITQFTLQSRANTSGATWYTLTDLTSAWLAADTIIRVSLIATDLNRVKQLVGLATAQSNTFLSITSLAVTDMAFVPNAVVPILSSAAMPVTEFTADRVRPNLMAFSLNLSSEVLTLTFDETVNASSLQSAGITLQNAASGANESVTLSGGSQIVINDIVLIINLLYSDVNAVKKLRQLCTNDADCYLSITDGSVLDMARNAINAVSNSNAKQVSNFFADKVQPQLLSFSINIDGNGSLTLTFDETVKASTFASSYLAIFNGPTLHNFTGGYYSTSASADSTMIEFVPLKTDLDAIKLITTLAVSANTSFLTGGSLVVSDMAGNQVVPFNVGPATSFTTDTTAPVLTSFALNMDTNLLAIFFSEPVNVSSVSPICATISNSLGAQAVTLGSSALFNVTNSDKIFISISIENMNQLKWLYPAVVSSTSTTYLRLSPCFVRDMAANSVIDSQLAEASIVYADQTSPQLLSFQLNMNTTTLSLTFDETVNASTFNISWVALLSGPLSSAQFQFTASSAITRVLLNGTVLEISISESDANAIKLLTSLARNLTTTYLALASSTIRDQAGNAVVPIGGSTPLLAFTYIQDTIRPIIRTFDLDMNLGVLTLYFSESVNAASILPAALQVARTVAGASAVALSRSTASAVNGAIQQVIIDQFDMNTIKQQGELAKSASTSFILVALSSAVDMNGNPIQSAVINCSVFTRDSNSPIPTVVNIDMNTQVLGILFNETVNASALIVGKIMVKSLAHQTAWTLVSADVTTSDGPYVNISLSVNDINQMMLLSLCERASDTVVEFFFGLTVDTAVPANPSLSVTLNVTNLAVSTIPPTLQSFGVNMDSGQVVLMFNIVVNTSSLYGSALTFQSASDGGIVYTVLSASTSSSNDWSIVVTLSSSDLNNMKKLSGLCVNISNCYVSLAPALINSMVGVPSLPILSTLAMVASVFAIDTVHPAIIGFGLDMNNGTITLNFSRTVNITSLISSQITVQRFSSGANAGSFWTIQAVTPVSSAPNTKVTLVLSKADLDSLKALFIGRDINSSWISTLPNAFRGMNGLTLSNAFNFSSALQASIFVSDSTPPTLVSFATSMNNGSVSLTFSETVDYNTFNLSGFSIAATNSSATLGFSASTFISSIYSPVLTLNISMADMNRIKATDSMFKAQISAYLAAVAGSILDMYGNPLVASPLMQASDFVQDTTAPVLMSFSMDQSTLIVENFVSLQTMSLTLTFSETIRKSSFQPVKILLQSTKATGGSTQSFQLTAAGAIVNASDPTVIMFKLTYNDSNAIKGQALLTKALNSTFLSISSSVVSDMAGNAAASIATNNAIAASAYAPDALPPQLYHFAMDLTAGTVSLTFDEPVSGATMHPTQITLQNAVQGPAVNLTLTGGLGLGSVAWNGNTFNYGTGMAVVVTLVKTDLNNVKALHFCTEPDDCYLVHTGTMIRDVAGNYIVACK